MKIHCVKDLQVLLFVLASTLMLISLPQVELAWTGIKTIYSKQDFGLRVLREAMLVGLASRPEAREHFGLDGRLPGDGRLIWKTSEPSFSGCCEIQKGAHHERPNLNLSRLKFKYSTKQIDDKIPA